MALPARHPQVSASTLPASNRLLTSLKPEYFAAGCSRCQERLPTECRPARQHRLRWWRNSETRTPPADSWPLAWLAESDRKTFRCRTIPASHCLRPAAGRLHPPPMSSRNDRCVRDARVHFPRHRVCACALRPIRGGGVPESAFPVRANRVDSTEATFGCPK